MHCQLPLLSQDKQTKPLKQASHWFPAYHPELITRKLTDPQVAHGTLLPEMLLLNFSFTMGRL